MGSVGGALGVLRANGLAIGREVLINIAAPLVIYQLTRRDLGEVQALIASSAPPLIWSIVEFVRHRRVDAISILALAGIVLSLLAFIGGGGVKFLQLREKLVTVLIGFGFLGSAAIGRPVIYELAHATMMRRSAEEAQSFRALRDNVYFRRSMMVMTLVWGFSLVIEAGAAGALVFVMPVAEFMIVSRIMGYGLMGALALWTVWYVRRQRRKGAARAAAEAAAATSDV